MLQRRSLLAGAATLAAPAIVRAQGAGAVVVGEINSYSAIPSFTLPYRNGWQLAVQEINAAGGVLGRRLEVISRDDAGKPQDAIRLAGELLDEQKVDLLAGGYLSNVGLALSDFALQRKRLFVAGEPLSDAMVWEKGNRYCFRLRPSTYMQAAMLVEPAAALKVKRWVTVAPNYEAARRAVRRRTMAGAGQDRRRRNGRRSGRGEARRHPQRNLRSGPDELRPPGQHARAVR
jgi:branched-chain amino acid transport system substrate-binding protein